MLLDTWGADVKVPIFVEANIHGGEREGTDAMMQVIRDLVTLPYGTNELVDDLLDHAIVVVIPTTNPDGRVAGRRANENAFDMNRDLLVQSQPEIRANTAFQLEWLAPVGLFMHGYYNPTLVDGLTKPHNPGLEYDMFLYWNQRRLDANEAAIEAIGREIQRPVNQWDERGRAAPTRDPAVAEGWDDWGPFYTQTYGAFFGVDGSTVEMCNDAACGGRLGSKREQYVVFYSSADFWLANRKAILRDQLEIFRRGVTGAARPNCCDDPLIAGRGFTEDQHNWMVEYPNAFLIPFAGGESGQRSDAEANRLVQWLLDNGVEVHRTEAELTWRGTTYPAGSYVVFMEQAFRGFAYTALAAGQDVSDRISQLYAPPGAWSHGSLWGADVLEIPADASFDPSTVPVDKVNQLQGGVRGGASRLVRRDAQGNGRDAGRPRPVAQRRRRRGGGGCVRERVRRADAGRLPDLPADATVAALNDAGAAAGIDFERGVGAKPATTQLDEAPRVAILVNSASPAESDTSWSLRQIFGPDVGFVSTVSGPNSLQNAVDRPPGERRRHLQHRADLPIGAAPPPGPASMAFFERGGGYIGTSQSTTNFAFLNGAHPALVTGNLTQGSDGAGGGIARWSNVGAGGPLTGGYAATDNLYLPSNVTWFSALPTGATVDGRYLPSTTDMFVAGLWRQRDPKAAEAPIIVHGTTQVGSRYLGLSTNPFSRGDAEREWPLIGQAALWSNLTDE